MARRGDGIYKRGNAWRLDIVHKGQRFQVGLGRNISRSVARELAQIERAKILKGEAGIGRKRKDILFDKAAEHFIAWARANKRPKTVECYESCMRNLSKFFSGKRLSQIHPFLIEKYKQARIAEGVSVAANRDLSRLKTLFYLCLDWKKYEGENPVCKVKFLEESPGRLRFLDDDEERRLLLAAEGKPNIPGKGIRTSEHLRTIILVGIYTGVRIQSEALTLKRDSLDLKRPCLTVETQYAKGKYSRTIPLNSILAEVLRKVPVRGEYVFAKQNGERLKSIKSAFDTACRRANLPDVTPHTLRHTFASRLAMAGVDLRTIQELGGWKSISMVMRYAHLSQKHKREAVELLVQNSPTLFPPAALEASMPVGDNTSIRNKMGR